MFSQGIFVSVPLPIQEGMSSLFGVSPTGKIVRAAYLITTKSQIFVKGILCDLPGRRILPIAFITIRFPRISGVLTGTVWRKSAPKEIFMTSIFTYNSS